MTNSFPHRSPSDLVVALLRGHSLLAGALTADVIDGDAFREGLAEGARRDLAASLFGICAASVLGVRGDADAASFASGVLIGAEVAARMADRWEARRGRNVVARTCRFRWSRFTKNNNNQM